MMYLHDSSKPYSNRPATTLYHMTTHHDITKLQQRTRNIKTLTAFRVITSKMSLGLHAIIEVYITMDAKKLKECITLK